MNNDVKENRVGMQLDNKISTGHILTAIVMGVSGLLAYKDTQSASLKNAADVQVLQSEVKSIKENLRVNDVILTTLSTEMKHVASGIVRIENALEKIKGGATK